MRNRFKVGDFIIYQDKIYWKIYEVLGVSEYGYRYKCLGSSYSYTNQDGCFSKCCLVEEMGKKVSKDDVTAFIVAKKL